MPYMKNDEKLANALKQFRTSHDIKAKDVADKLEKTPAYISKLESNDLVKVDFELISKYIKIISNDTTEINNFFGGLIDSYDRNSDDIELNIKIRNLDEVVRQLSLTGNVKNMLVYINKEMQENNISVDKIVREINSNSDITPEIIKKADIQKYNMWQLINNDSYIIFNVKEEEIRNILECQENTFCNYVTLEVIAYSLFKLSGIAKDEAREKAREMLKQYRIFTLKEKDEIRKKRKSYEKLEDLFAETDVENVKLINQLIQKFVNLSNLDIAYANKVLSAILKNMDADISLAVAIMKYDISELQTKSTKQKSEFLKEFSSLINKYKMQEDEKQIVYY